MRSDRQKSPDSERRASHAASADDEVVQTFVIEVGAGRRRDSSSSTETLVPKKSRGLAVARLPAALPAAPSRQATPQREKPAAGNRRPSWLTSLVVHAALLLALSFITLVTVEQEELSLWASHVPPEELVVDFPEIEIEPSTELASYESNLPTEMHDPGISSLGQLSADSALAESLADGALPAGGLQDMGSLFDEEGGGLSDTGGGDGGASTSFFGTESQARRVVFVIDNTGSMSHGGLETVIVELLNTVGAMSPNQQFYVLFFSDQVYPLFFPRPEPGYLPATKQNIQELEAWLNSVEICTGGVWQLTQAMDAAYGMNPDVVYLLSDGRHWDSIRADYKIKAVEALKTRPNTQGILVHTLGMGCQADEDRENLASVARVNSGVFREVEVTPAMKERAKQRERPYHSAKPGTVWGTEVQGRADKAEE